MTGRYRGIVSGFLTGILVLPLLCMLAFPSPVSADDAQYSAGDIKTWLVDAISSTQVTITEEPPSVTLDDANNRMIVDDFAFTVRGVTVGLTELRMTFAGTQVEVNATLNVFDRTPKLSCLLEVSYLDSENQLRVVSVSDVQIVGIDGNYEPGLSPSDLNAIADCLNNLIDASELSISAPAGEDLTGISVTGSELVTTWTPSTLQHTITGLENELNDMATTLANKANGYLGATTPEWSTTVDIIDTTAVVVGLDFSLCGKQVILEANFEFSGLTASFTDATLSVGTKTATFSGSGDISSSAHVPAIAMVSFSLNADHPGLQSFIADIEDLLLDAIDEAVDSIVSDTGLTLGVAMVSNVYVDGVYLIVEGANIVEGDVTMDGKTNIVDAMVIAQYTVGLREFDADQMVAGDTTDDGSVNIVDAMHVAQFTVDPTGSAGILFKPLWEAEHDEGITIDPLAL